MNFFKSIKFISCATFLVFSGWALKETFESYTGLILQKPPSKVSISRIAFSVGDIFTRLVDFITARLPQKLNTQSNKKLMDVAVNTILENMLNVFFWALMCFFSLTSGLFLLASLARDQKLSSQ